MKTFRFFMYMTLMYLFFASCQKSTDDAAVSTTGSSTTKAISLQDLKNTNIKAYELLTSLSAKADANAKTVYDSKNDYYIDTDYIIEYKTNDFICQTFGIYRKERRAFDENLIILTPKGKEASSYLIRYQLTDEDRQAYYAGHEITNINQKIQISAVASKSCAYWTVDCQTRAVINYMANPITEGNLGSGHGIGELITYETYNCQNNFHPCAGDEAGGTGGGVGGGAGSGGGGGGGGGVTPPITGNPGEVGIPNFPIFGYTPIINTGYQNFFAGLTGDQALWLLRQSDEVQSRFKSYFRTLNNMNNTQKEANAKMILQQMILGNCSILDIHSIDDEIIAVLPFCMSNVLNDLKAFPLPGEGFTTIMQDFIAVDKLPLKYKLKIQMGSLGPNKGGQTQIVTNGTATALITLNEDYKTISTDLSWAKTIIHEMFHAYLLNALKYQISAADGTDYQVLMDRYITWYSTQSNAQHNIFANTKIIKQISAAIKQYGESKNYQLPQQFYDDMAWGGLKNTYAFSALPLADQTRILNTVNAEFFNSVQAGSSITPVGHPLSCP